MAELRLIALDGVGEIRPGTDLAEVITAAIGRNGLRLKAADVIVLAQKIVSKAEGRQVDLATVTPSERAQALAAETLKDPRVVELVLAESTEVLRAKPNVLIVEHRLGMVMANAGIDQSNVPADGREIALLLPRDPEASCRTIREALRARTGIDMGVMIIDSIGRAWRQGTVGHALGLSGLPGWIDLRGRTDRDGRVLQASDLGFADELAAAASLIMGQGAEGRPIVLARGVPYERREGSVNELLRPRNMDLFR